MIKFYKKDGYIAWRLHLVDMSSNSHFRPFIAIKVADECYHERDEFFDDLVLYFDPTTYKLLKVLGYHKVSQETDEGLCDGYETCYVLDDLVVLKNMEEERKMERKESEYLGSISDYIPNEILKEIQEKLKNGDL